MNRNIKAPAQYRQNLGMRLFKKFLHTKTGAMLGHYIGLSGFNKVVAIKYEFLRYYTGNEYLKKGEIVEQIGETFKYGIYRKVKAVYGFNSRVNKGGDLSASLMSGSSLNSIASPLPPIYIANSTSVLTPAAGDTTLSGETAAAGLARALGTVGGYIAPSVLDGSCSYTIVKTFTNTSGGSVTLNSCALFDAVAVGNLFAEANLSTARVLANNDKIVITWTVNL
jgi:hypothetical protein